MIKPFFKRILYPPERKNIFSTFQPNPRFLESNQHPVFVSGVGRSGTHFIAKLFDACKQLQAWHLDDVGDQVGDAFEWYSRWYNLPVDHQGFIQSRGFLIQQAADKQKRFFESNPMIAFSLADLHQHFGGKIIIMVRHPKEVVESHFRKGWYAQLPAATSTQIPGYGYYHKRPNHYFSRILPSQPEERTLWQLLPRLGKIAWMWQATYHRILQQMDEGLPEHCRFVYLNSFDYQAYRDLAAWLELPSTVSEQQFQAIVKQKPGKGKKQKQLISWDTASRNAFSQEVEKVIGQLASFVPTEDWIEE